MKKKQTKASSRDKTKDLVEILKKHGAQVYEDLDNGQFPKISIPNRSISNIVYDKKLRQYVLGTNTALRSAKNASQLCKTSRIFFIKQLFLKLPNYD